MTRSKSGQGRKTAKALIDALEHRRFYRNGPDLPEGAGPIDPGNAECKWYFLRLLGDASPTLRAFVPSSFAAELRIVSRERGSKARKQTARRPVPKRGSALARTQVSAPSPLTGRPAGVQRPRASLTQLLGKRRFSGVQAAWDLFLPGTTELVKSINRAAPGVLFVQKGTWTEASCGRPGVLGTAYDYVVGALWAGSSLDGVFARVRRSIRRWPKVQSVGTALEGVLRKELARIRKEPRTAPIGTFLRGVVLLAELDATSRSPAVPPPWTLALPRIRLTEKGFIQLLLEHYPEDLAIELSQLFDATRADLNREGELIYNPVFGGARGLGHIAADGDLIVGDMLLELKVLEDPYGRAHLWQLLGYAALDRLHGRARIGRVGLYNPRRRYLWSEDIEVFAQRLGAGSIDGFCRWFRDTPAANGLAPTPDMRTPGPEGLHRWRIKFEQDAWLEKQRARVVLHELQRRMGIRND